MPAAIAGVVRSVLWIRTTKQATLAAAGIGWSQSKVYERLAQISAPAFEKALADTKGRLSTRRILRTAWTPRRPNVVAPPLAFKLWQRLLRFRDLLDADAIDIASQLTPAMRREVDALAPRVIEWLQRLGEGQGGRASARARKRRRQHSENPSEQMVASATEGMENAA